MGALATHALVVRCRSRIAAIPIAHVIEIMRPLPIETVASPPPFVLGLAVIRGEAVPVVDLAAMLTGEPAAPGRGRFVALRAGSRAVALAVDEVIGVEPVDASDLGPLPPLVGEIGPAIAALGVADAQLMVVLRASHVIPEELWRAMEQGR